jgi:hypothetical protein
VARSFPKKTTGGVRVVDSFKGPSESGSRGQGGPFVRGDDQSPVGAPDGIIIERETKTSRSTLPTKCVGRPHEIQPSLPIRMSMLDVVVLVWSGPALVTMSATSAGFLPSCFARNAVNARPGYERRLGRSLVSMLLLFNVCCGRQCLLLWLLLSSMLLLT